MTKEKAVKRLEKKYITNQNKRGVYIYSGANQPPITITPGENGVTEVDIKIIHEMDDEETRAWNRYIEKTNHYIDDFVGDSQAEHNKVLADWDANPINEIVEMENYQEKQELINELSDAMRHLTEKQLSTIQKKFFENRTNVDIAAEEGVTEAAIRNRLTKIYRRLKKLIREGS
ncbi:sigma-70 family RNA polymerase sigma factor [Siminovitchia sp. FSL H7-0308]|uniref:RNA polymerase sigma factor n=1 Tax=Siminovitchia sp. FSL H7-0308 TaxID=2921432 RepID=UPI0030EBDDFA